MKNNTRKTNSYTQGHQLTARVLLILWLLGSCGLGSTLAAPESQEASQTITGSSSLPLGTVSEHISGLINTIKNNESLRRRKAAIQTLQQSSTNFNADERKTVLEALEGLITDTKLEALGGLITDTESFALHLRSLAFDGILEICKEQSNDIYDFLARATKSPYPDVRKSVIDAIALKSESEVITFLQVLSNLVQDPDCDVSQLAVQVFDVHFSIIEYSKALDVLISATHAQRQQHAMVRKEAVDCLSSYLTMSEYNKVKNQVNKILEAFCNATLDEDKFVRQAAVQALGQNLKSLKGDDPSKALQALIEAATKYSNTDVRQAAVEALGQNLKSLKGDDHSKALEALIQATADQDSNVRQAAVEALGQNLDALKGDDPSKALEALIEAATKHSNTDVRQAAVEALGQNLKSLKGDDHSKALKALIEATADQESNVRRFAVQALGQNFDSLKGDDSSKALKALIKAKADQDSNVRRFAVWALKKFFQACMELKNTDAERPKVLQILIEAKADQDSNVRQAAVWALRQNLKSLEGNDPSKALEALIEAKADQDSNVRRFAVEALGQNFKSFEGNDHSKALEALIEATADQDSNVRQAAVEALAYLSALTREEISLISTALRKATMDQDKFVSRFAVRALGQNLESLKGEEELWIQTFEALIDVIDTSAAQDSNVHEAVLKAFQQLQDEPRDKVSTILIKTTKAKDSDIRLKAVEALGQSLKSLKGDDPIKALQALIEATADQDSNVRRFAVQALADLPGLIPSEIPLISTALCEATKDPNEDVRQAAVKALGNIIGAQYAHLLDNILQCLQDIITTTKDASYLVVVLEKWGCLDTINAASLDSVVSFLSECVNDQEKFSGRHEAVRALGKIGGKHIQTLDRIVPFLTKISKKEDGDSAVNTAKEVLREITLALAKEASPTDARHAAPEASRRRAAVEALGKFFDNLTQQGKRQRLVGNVLQALRKATKDDNPDVRHAVVTALENLAAQLEGEKREAVLQALCEATKDSDQQVRDAANNALDAANKALQKLQSTAAPSTS